MNRRNRSFQFSISALSIVFGVLVIAGIIFLVVMLTQPVSSASDPRQTLPSVTFDPPLDTPTATHTPSPSATATRTPTPLPTNTSTVTPTPTDTATATPIPTPTLDLAACSVLGCDSEADPPPTLEFNSNLFLTNKTPRRTACLECPENEVLSEEALNELIEADQTTLAQLQEIARSQQPYQIAPGVIYIVSNHVHHVVVDLQEPGFELRNILPTIPDRETQEKIRITPSFCMRPESLVVTDADYHGLVGSNKTAEGRELFYHLGRAALFLRDNRYDIDVIADYPVYADATASWGGGPIFIYDGEYDFNPEEEWFEPDVLEYYRTAQFGKMTVAISLDRKYLFLTASYGITLEQHAENIIDLGKKWGIEIDRAMRFDGTENAYMAIRLGNHLVPILNTEEPLIVNCLAIEKTD